MNESERELFEKRLLSLSKGFDYPRTPDIAGSVRTLLKPVSQPRLVSRYFGSAQHKLLVWSITFILVLFSSLMLIPPARAAIIEFIQIGIVRIFPRAVEGTPSPITGSPAPVTATSQSLIPLRDATIRDGDVVVGYDKDMVTNAPPLEDDEGSLSRGQEEKLYDYYGISYDATERGAAWTPAEDLGTTTGAATTPHTGQPVGAVGDSTVTTSPGPSSTTPTTRSPGRPTSRSQPPQ